MTPERLKQISEKCKHAPEGHIWATEGLGLINALLAAQKAIRCFVIASYSHKPDGWDDWPADVHCAINDARR